MSADWLLRDVLRTEAEHHERELRHAAEASRLARIARADRKAARTRRRWFRRRGAVTLPQQRAAAGAERAPVAECEPQR